MAKRSIAKKPLFMLGQTVATPGALEIFANLDGHITTNTLLARHQAGDWGDLDPEDAKMNDAAVKDGDRILSSYQIGTNKIWIVTEYDRSVTTLLRPEDY